MRNLVQTSCLLVCGALFSLVGFSGCDTIDNSENISTIASMKTFYMAEVTGSVGGFSSRNQQDVLVLTQEMVARQLESLGYQEVGSDKDADMTVIPSWSFYQDRKLRVQNNDPTLYESPLNQASSANMARMGVEVLGGSGQVLWSSLARWGVTASVATANDFSRQAELALQGFPDCEVAPEAKAAPAMPPLPPLPVGEGEN
ncbi:hypothetical protein [Ruficoccus sp. ZRK36]|uniref:hypothetical protein n=1 Tax=Ruficoccus sp. ZRK36 TaxID=2866311 RepID=UPI001C738CE7|nr:hypothetical protein [Ruficoccus sp. ZRK36]QYY34457.1 hypothetical protein K0V07_09055 [Ruficoccus sp. ZRK36]